MEALVTSFVAALLAGWTDKTQLVTAALAETTKRPLLVLAGLVLALAASNIIAAMVLAAEMGDRTQFLTFALAGRFDSAPFAAAGATAGALAACLPAFVLGNRLQTIMPMRALRYAAAALFLLVGFITAVQALQLT